MIRVTYMEPLPYGIDRQPEPFLHPDPDEDAAVHSTAVKVYKSSFWHPWNTIAKVSATRYEIRHEGVVLATVEAV